MADKKKVTAKRKASSAEKTNTKTQSSKAPKNVRAVKKGPQVKKSSSTPNSKKLEVRNAHASKNKKQRKLPKITISKKVDTPHIYDEIKYEKMLKKNGKKALNFTLLFFAFLYILAVLFILKLELTHTRNGQDLEKEAENTYTSTTSVEANRGTIYDANGDALAINLEVYDIKAITSSDWQCKPEGETKYKDCSFASSGVTSAKAGSQIAKALGLDSDAADYFTTKIKSGVDNGKYEVSFGTYGKNITLSQKQALEKLGYNWLDFTPKKMRFYPYGDFASYIVGYTTQDDDGNIEGAMGAEKALDGHLRGQDGVETSSFDKYGIELTDAQKSVLPKIDGTDVYLTLDTTIQTYLESSMEKALSADDVKNIKYEGLFTIVMDAKTGDIYAAQSYPSFDPNERDIENYTNYFTNYCFEPGSTFKAATVAAAKESGVWNDTKTESTGTRSASTWAGAKIQDWNNGVGWGNLTWAQGFYMSSNTVMTHIMDALDKEYWTDFVSNKLLIGTPVETQFITTPSCDFSPQYDLEYATTSFGQGLTVNVLQLLRMYSALVNDGTMVTPHIVSEIKDSDTGETVYTDDDLDVIDDVVSEDTSDFILELLRGVVTYDNGTIQGTGSQYQGGTYDIGMKTGTSQIVGDNGQYLKNKYLYSTMAVAPADDPQLIIYTAVIKPNETNISYKAFPQYVKEVFDNSLSYLNSENKQIDVSSDIETKTVKNYVGKTLGSVQSSRNVVKIGNGKITSQYPKAGQKIATDQKVILIGTKNLKMPDITGYTYNEAVAVCNELDVTCEFKNQGSYVKSVKEQSDAKYQIKME